MGRIEFLKAWHPATTMWQLPQQQQQQHNNKMKLTHNTKLKPGMTLIELTVVIIVLLTLISVLFFAGTAYIKASNRTACLANQATFQKAMRGWATLNQKEASPATVTDDALAVTIVWDDVTSEGFIGVIDSMVCPTAKVEYDPKTRMPAQGEQVAPCQDPTYSYTAPTPVVATAVADAADDGMHIPSDIGNW